MEFMILTHDILHIVTALVALALFVLSLISYHRTGRRKLLYVGGAFSLFMLREILLAIGGDAHLTDHILNLAILVLFAIGVLRE